MLRRMSAPRGSVAWPRSKPEAQRASRASRFARHGRHACAPMAPALDGDYVASPASNLDASAAHRAGPVSSAPPAPAFWHTTLTDLGMFGNSLEVGARRPACTCLMLTETATTLRSGMHDSRWPTTPFAYGRLPEPALRTSRTHGRTRHLRRSPGRWLRDREQSRRHVRTRGRDRRSLPSASSASMPRPGPTATGHAQHAILSATSSARASTSSRAHDYVDARCAAPTAGRAIPEAPPEYMPRLLIQRVHTLARLGRGARSAHSAAPNCVRWRPNAATLA